MEIIDRLKEFLKINALKKVSKNQIEVHGPMVPLNEVVQLLEAYKDGTLESWLNERDRNVPDEIKTTRSQ